MSLFRNKWFTMDEMAYVEQTPSKYKNILEYKNPFTKCMNKCYK